MKTFSVVLLGPILVALPAVAADHPFAADILIKQLRKHEGIAEGDTLLLTIQIN